jgi:hypothetical protein
MELFKRLDEFGYEKTRRAVAALSLSFFVSLYLLVAMNAPPGWGPAFLALAACYVVAFLALAAEWFWGRWFASGLGWSGLMVAVISLVMIGWAPPLAIYGGLHLVVVVALMGKKMVAQYDLQETWRQRYGMDEFGVARLRKTVTRAAASLPSLILWALGPKEGDGSVVTALGVAATLLATTGLWAVLRARVWGLLAMAGACAAVVLSGTLPVHLSSLTVRGWSGSVGTLGTVPIGTCLATTLIALLLAFTVTPFLGPALRFLRRSR